MVSGEQRAEVSSEVRKKDGPAFAKLRRARSPRRNVQHRTSNSLQLKLQQCAVGATPRRAEGKAEGRGRRTEVIGQWWKIARMHFSSKFTRVKGQRVALAAGLFLTGIALATPGTKESPVIVDLHAHRGEIRAALLQCTPLGASLKNVLDFISKQLQQNGGASPLTVEAVKDDSESHVAKSVRAYLGQYYDHPEVVFLSAPLLMQKEVTAQWLFDSHDRLINVVVEKKNGIY
jgi:hypothetical protein